MADRKFSSVAGPRQTKQVAEAISAFNWRSKSVIEKYGVIGGEESEHEVTPMVTGTMTAESRVTYDRLGEKYAWEITRENYRSILADFGEATKALVLPVIDQRRSPEAETERQAKFAETEAERKAKASTFAADVDKIEAELRATYPFAVASDTEVEDWHEVATDEEIELLNLDYLAFLG